MYRYTIQAYNQDITVGATEKINVVVVAANEDAAIKKARTIAVRTNYAVIQIEDLRGAELKKIK